MLAQLNMDPARARTAVVTFVFSKVNADAAPIEVMRIQVPLRALSCRDVEVLTESEAFLPTCVFVRDDPAVYWLGYRLEQKQIRHDVCNQVSAAQMCQAERSANAPELLDRANFREEVLELSLGDVVGQVADCTAQPTASGMSRLVGSRRSKGRSQHKGGDRFAGQNKSALKQVCVGALDGGIGAALIPSLQRSLI